MKYLLQNRRLLGMIVFFTIAFSCGILTGCNEGISPKAEQEESKEETSQSPDEENGTTGNVENSASSGKNDEAFPDEQYETKRQDSIRQVEELMAELERRRLEKESEKRRKAFLENESVVSGTDEKVEKRQPVARRTKMKYYPKMNVRLLDERISWSPVGPGLYDISVIRAADNAVVFSRTSADTTLAYAGMELDESIRYNLKISYPKSNLSEKKTFSLIGKGTMLNPTCK